jgi:hypothetical protein
MEIGTAVVTYRVCLKLEHVLSSSNRQLLLTKFELRILSFLGCYLSEIH